MVIWLGVAAKPEMTFRQLERAALERVYELLQQMGSFSHEQLVRCAESCREKDKERAINMADVRITNLNA